MDPELNDPQRNLKPNRFMALLTVPVVTTLLLVGIQVANAQEASFITVWKTDNPGISQNNQITIHGRATAIPRGKRKQYEKCIYNEVLHRSHCAVD